MAKKVLFAPMPEDEAANRLKAETPMADEVAASMSGKPIQTKPELVLVPAQESHSEPGTASTRVTRDVPVEDILINRLNARKLPPTSVELDKLSTSMKKQQDTPAAGYLDKLGRVCLIDGHRRLAAAKSGGIATLRIEFQPEPLSPLALYLSSRSYNVERESQSVLDDAFAWKQMLDEKIFSSQVEISREVGFNEADISRILNLTTFTPRIIDLLNGQHSLLNLRMLSAIRLYFTECGEEATKALIISAEDGLLSSREVDKLRKAFNKDKVFRTRSDTKSQLFFTNGNATLKHFDTARKLVIEIDSVEEGVSLREVSDMLKNAMVAALGGVRPDPGT